MIETILNFETGTVEILSERGRIEVSVNDLERLIVLLTGDLSEMENDDRKLAG